MCGIRLRRSNDCLLQNRRFPSKFFHRTRTFIFFFLIFFFFSWLCAWDISLCRRRNTERLEFSFVFMSIMRRHLTSTSEGGNLLLRRFHHSRLVFFLTISYTYAHIFANTRFRISKRRVRVVKGFPITASPRSISLFLLCSSHFQDYFRIKISFTIEAN